MLGKPPWSRDAPLFDPQPSGNCARALASGLTARQVLDPALYETVFRTLPAAIVLIDGEGTVMDANRAAHDWLAEGGIDEDLVGEAWRDVAAAAFRPRPDDGHDVSLANGRRVNMTVSALEPGPGLAVLMSDVSETRVQQGQRAEATRLAAMGKTIGAVAHQLRTPLAAALLAVGSLPRSAVQTRVVDRLQRIEALLEDMLGYARLGGFELSRLPVGEFVQALQSSIKDDQTLPVDFVVAQTCRPLLIWCHLGALVSALQNLVENACEAGATHMQFVLDGPRDNRVNIRCIDDGPGIPDSLRQNLFEPFVSGGPKSSGLGLSIVRSIVEAHGGDINLEPAATGAAFVMRLPIDNDEATR
ncbi:MAG: PAS domain-containing sensor histidine kinase [Pseudomonadota bacterium]